VVCCDIKCGMIVSENTKEIELSTHPPVLMGFRGCACIGAVYRYSLALMNFLQLNRFLKSLDALSLCFKMSVVYLSQIRIYINSIKTAKP
jgi:hypothetical protein